MLYRWGNGIFLCLSNVCQHLKFIRKTNAFLTNSSFHTQEMCIITKMYPYSFLWTYSCRFSYLFFANYYLARYAFTFTSF